MIYMYGPDNFIPNTRGCVYLGANKYSMHFLSVKSVCQLLGWIGTFSYLLAYFFLSINKINAKQFIYQFLNVIGAIGLTTNAIYYADLPNVVVNLVWGVIALSALVVIFWKQKKQN